jgi:hypothetical protein
MKRQTVVFTESYQMRRIILCVPTKNIMMILKKRRCSMYSIHRKSETSIKISRRKAGVTILI